MTQEVEGCFGPLVRAGITAARAATAGRAAAQSVNTGVRVAAQSVRSGGKAIINSRPAVATGNFLKTASKKTGLTATAKTITNVVRSPGGQMAIAGAEIGGAVATAYQINKAYDVMDETIKIANAAAKRVDDGLEEIYGAQTGFANEGIAMEFADDILRAGQDKTGGAVAAAIKTNDLLPEGPNGLINNPNTITKFENMKYLMKDPAKMKFLIKNSDPLLLQRVKDSKISIDSMDSEYL